MNEDRGTSLERRFGRFATLVAHATGRPWTFVLSVMVVLVWAATGPLFHYSDTWQLVINTGTTIVTFLMVFLIQSTQNRDGAAIQAKLDELIRASAAQNRFMGVEDLTEPELKELREEHGTIVAGVAEAVGEAQNVADERARRAADRSVGL